MKYFKIITLVFMMISTISCKSQKLNKYEQTSREKADLVVENIFNKEKKPYVLLSISNKFYLVINKEDNFIQETIVEFKKGEINKTVTNKIDKTNKLFSNLFNRDDYHKEFIGFQSDFFKNGYEKSNGNMFYFVMKDVDNNRYGETCLSLIIKPNPLRLDLFDYMVYRLVNN